MSVWLTQESSSIPKVFLSALVTGMENLAAKCKSLTRDKFHWDKKDSIFLLMVVLASLFLLLPRLGAIGILDPSDAYYSEGAREMVESGNYLTPHLNYVPWFEKPILVYWLISLSYKVFGISEWAARLPSAVAALCLAIGSYFCLRLLVRRSVAVMASLMIISSPLVLVVAHMAMTDLPWTALLWFSLLGFFFAVEKNSTPSAYAAYVLLALSVLCKGPVGIFFIGVILASYLIITRRSLDEIKQAIKRIHLLPGICLVMAIALPWYVMETIATNGVFFQEFVIRQNIGRALGNVNHKAAFWYYTPFLVAGFFPWVLFSPFVFPIVRSLLRKRQLPSLRVRTGLFCLVAAVFIIGFFTVVKAKLATYILPAFPPLCVLVAFSLDSFIRVKRRQLFWSALPAVAVSAAIAATIFVLAGKQMLGDGIVMAASGAALMFISSAMLLWRRQNRRGISLLMAAMIFVCSTVVPTALFVNYNLNQRKFAAFVRYVGERNQAPIILGRLSPSVVFYLHRPVQFMDKAAEVNRFLSANQNTRFIIVQAKKVAEMKGILLAQKLVDHDDHWYLYEVVR